MGARVAPTFIRHRLASILSCSTILRAWPILIVLFTGVSPFILEEGHDPVLSAEALSASTATRLGLCPIFCPHIISTLQWPFLLFFSVGRMEKSEMLSKSPGHGHQTIQMI